MIEGHTVKKASGDKSKKVGSTRRVKGPSAPTGSVAKKPRGKPITHARGAAGYHNR